MIRTAEKAWCKGNHTRPDETEVTEHMPQTRHRRKVSLLLDCQRRRMAGRQVGEQEERLHRAESALAMGTLTEFLLFIYLSQRNLLELRKKYVVCIQFPATNKLF